MKTHFINKFNGIDFEFERVLIRNQLWYEVQFNNNGNNGTFKMYPDSENNWYIVKQELPEWIKELEIEFNEAILDNERS